MQPNSNRPVYIVQSSNLTPLNVRPTIITTGGQTLQTQQQQHQPVYQISTVRQQTLPQQPSPLYQVQPQPQPRLFTSSPAYASLQTQRFTTSPQQQILPTNSNTSPRLITQQMIPRMSMVATQPNATIVRPSLTTISTPPMATSISQPSAPGSKEFAVKVPKTPSQYGIMEFANGISIDLKDWKSVEMKREINPYTYRPATNLDSTASSASNSITTSLGAVLPKTGAGSEFGREQKEALKRKRYATKGTNVEDLPWLLTDRSSSEKKLKHYRGLKKGGVTANSSYYVFIQGADGFEAYPVEDWYGFTSTNVYKTLDFDEAEKQYEDRNKVLSKWFSKHQLAKEKAADDEVESDDEKGDKGKKPTKKKKRDFKLMDAHDLVDENEDEDDDNGSEPDDNDKSNPKSKGNKKNGKKANKGQGFNLSDDDEEETTKPPVKKKEPKQRQTDENQGEDSEDGDHDGDEIEYTSDESSDDEDDAKGADTEKSSKKYEIKDIAEEMRTIPDIDKKLEQMDENGDELDFDDDDEEEEVPDIDDNDDDNDMPSANDEPFDTEKLKSEAASKGLDESSSDDDDDLDDSDDPDKEMIEPVTSSINTQPIPSEQVKTEKGHKKAREEEMRAIKTKVMSLPTTPAASSSSNPTETITEDKVRSLLIRKQHMTFTELIQNFLPKAEHLRTKEIKDGIVQKLAAVIRRLNIEEKMINGKKHIKLKS